MLEIDGSYGECGGSIVRTAVGLSVFTGKPLYIYNVRKNRPQPGLKVQHLQGVKAAAELCGGKIIGAELGSTEIKFFPEKNFSDKVKVEIETAGSIGLVLQVLQIAALKAEKKVKVEIRGGATYGKWAPPIDFVQNVFYKILEKIGYKIDLEVERHGFYPKGRARVNAIFYPANELKGLNLIEQGKLENVSGLSIASKHLEQKKVAERQKISARGEIFNKLQVSPNIKTEYLEAENIGSAITLWLTTQSGAILGASKIGEQTLRAEIVGKEASQSLIEDFKSDATIDRHSLDQIIPFLALSRSASTLKFSKLTSHAHTNIWVCEQFFGKILHTHENILTKNQYAAI
ncbi:TPA: RNA 3'-terminal phosphate cyclase [archaeon]|nr:RNA 3'-terminal phosphate cyclase [Candidatus Naiadarchaeales archaeon SRR2090153.bin1042]